MSRLYHCQNFSSPRLFELDLDTLASVDNSGFYSSSVMDVFWDVDGDDGSLYGAGRKNGEEEDPNEYYVWQFDEETLAITSTHDTGVSYDFKGLGACFDGDWYGLEVDGGDSYLELDDTDDFSISSTASALGSSPTGIGGMGDRLFACADGSHKIYEIDPDTQADLSSGGVTSPGTSPFGVGGTYDRLFHSDNGSGDKIFEIDPDTLTDISSGGTSSPTGFPGGIGGTKELSNPEATPEDCENTNECEDPLFVFIPHVQNTNEIQDSESYVSISQDCENTNEIETVLLCNVLNIQNTNEVSECLYALAEDFENANEVNDILFIDDIENANEIGTPTIARQVSGDPFEMNLDFQNFNFLDSPLPVLVPQISSVDSVENENSVSTGTVVIATFNYGKIRFTRKEINISNPEVFN